MDLHFLDPGLDYSIEGLLAFQQENQTEWWREALFLFYPQVDRARFDAMHQNERRAYLRETLAEVYANARPEIAAKTESYLAHWEKHRTQVEAAFSDAFGTDARAAMNDMRVRITLNPICPRYLQERAFDVFYRNSDAGALGMSLHEMIHFAWFDVWQRAICDDPAEYESPSLKWVFSEMAVEPLMRDRRLAEINPYFQDGCAYEYFYDMKIEGQKLFDQLERLHRENDILGFMKKGYAFCREHEPEIRAQMR